MGKSKDAEDGQSTLVDAAAGLERGGDEIGAPEVGAERESGDKPKGKKRGWRKGKPRARGKSLTTVDIGRAVALHLRGNGVPEIARSLGRHPTAIQQTLDTLAPIFREIPHIDTYEDIRRKLFVAAEYQFLKLLCDPRAQESATLRDRAFAFDRIFAASRLERGLSTANTAAKTFGSVTVQHLKLEKDPEKPLEIAALLPAKTDT